MAAATMAYKWRATIIVVIGLFLSVLDTTSVSVALPAMRADFHTEFNTITWVVSAYFLAQAAIIPITGYLTDRIGTREVFIAAMVIFVIGSFLCFVAPSKEALIIARVVQGIGGGALFPTCFAIVYRAFPRDEWGRAMAVIGLSVLVGPALGPVIGGYLTTTFGWRAIFAVNLPIGLAAVVAAALILRRRSEELGGEEGGMEGRFDIAGLVLSIVGFTGLVYGLTEAGIFGWDHALVVYSLLIAALVLAVLVAVELRRTNPVLDVRVFRYLTFSRATVLLWVVVGYYFGSLFLIPFFFQKVEGLSALTSGEIMISMGAAAAIGVAVGGEMYTRFGPRVMATTGVAALTLSNIGFMHLGVATTGLSLQGWLILRGLGLGFATMPLQNLALSVVDRRDLARGTSLINVTRQVSSAAGVAALAAYAAQQAVTHAATAVSSLHTANPTPMAAACATRKAGLAACVERHAIVMGLNDAFTIGLVVCAVAVVLALTVGRDPSLEALKGEVGARIAGAFPELSHDVLVEAASRAQPLFYQAGDVIIRQGEKADRFYVITSGEVRASRSTGSGEEVDLRVLGPGQYFGEVGLLANLPRTATVTAASVVEVLALNEATFADLVGRSEEAGKRVRRDMAERLAVLP